MSWFRPSARAAPRRSTAAPRRRPRLERLEDRTTPTQFTWSGLGPDPRWSDGANWVGGAVPHPSVVGDPVDLLFPAGAAQPTSLNDLGPITFNSITFDGGGYAVADQALNLTGALTANNPDGTADALDVPVMLSAGGGSQVIAVTTAGAKLTLSQPLSCNPGVNLVKPGAGTLVLNGDDSQLSAAIDVQAGVLQAGAATALGSPAQGTTVEPGAALWLTAGIGAEPLTLSGDGLVAGGQSTGALRAVSGNLVASGAVSLRGSVTIGADAGSQLPLGGPIDDGKQGFGLTKALPGTLRLAPAAGAGNTYGGATDVAQGILVLAQDGALAGSAATTVAAGAQLQLSGGITATTGPVTLAVTAIS